jgi:hypothetical protein
MVQRRRGQWAIRIALLLTRALIVARSPMIGRMTKRRITPVSVFSDSIRNFSGGNALRDLMPQVRALFGRRL